MRGSGVWLVPCSVASIQIGAAIAKLLFGRVEPSTLVWLRLALAACVLLVVAMPRLRGRSPRDWAAVTAYGAALAVMNISLYQAIARIPLGTAVTIEFLGPLTVATLGSRRLRDWCWILLAGAGVALLGAAPSDLDPVGVGFAFLAATAWGAYIVLSTHTGRRWTGISGLAVGSTIGTLIATPVMLGASGWVAPTDVRGLDDPWVWLIGLFVALLSTVVPYSLEMIALRRIPPAVFGILMSLEPAAAAIAGMLVVGEFIGPVEWTAVVCVMAASIGSVRTSHRA